MFIFTVHLFAEEAVDVNLIAVSGTPPVLTLDPNAIEDNLNIGEISEHEIIVANEGEAELRVVIEAEIGDTIGVRSMMMISLGFDHRLIDGSGGSMFINSVCKNLSNMDMQSLNL